MKSPRVVFLEFNELSPSLMDRFVKEGHLPNFRRLREQSHIYTTQADEPNFPHLEPWIQWVTIHCGLRFQEHQVFHLGDGPALKAKCIWDVLSSANHKVAVCGSMNVRYDAPVNGYVLPDPWTTGVKPYPESLSPYARFVQANVQEYSNDRVPLKKSDYLSFLQFMASHGLSTSTVISIVKQLASERGANTRWRRAFILDRLQFDVFRSLYLRDRPEFATFFLNSTAHMQHIYWRNMQPELFKVKPTEQEQKDFAAAILTGYQEMDDLVGKTLDMVDDDTYVFFMTALSQQPCLIYEESGGKILYRPRSFDDFLKFAGVQGPYEVEPVMAEQFHVHFKSEAAAEAAALTLASLKVDGERAAFSIRDGSSVFCGSSLFQELPKEAALVNAAGKSARFFELFYRIEGMKSGMHHPDGMLWVRTPAKEHRVHGEKVELVSLMPTVLNLFGAEAPANVKGKPLAAIAPQSALAGVARG